jgi:hypothetical protein
MNAKIFKISAIAGLTALVAMATGCLNDSSSRKPANANLVVVASVKDANKKGLGKAATISLKKLIITMTSNNVSDAVRRDTVLADTGAAFVSSVTSNQALVRSYALNPLRNWTLVVKTLDTKDSVIHYDSVTVTGLNAGETRTVPLNLTARYVMYEAKFTIPDSVNFTQSVFKRDLLVHRVVLKVDGVIVADSTTNPRFLPGSPTPTVHTVRFDYIRVNQTPDVKVEFWGKIGGQPLTDTLLFSTQFDDVDPYTPNPTPKAPDYVGPPASELGNIATVNFQINIGKVGTVIFNTDINGNVNAKAAAH